MAVMVIQGAEVLIKEYRGRRVMTFRDIDTVHQRPQGTAQKCFGSNAGRLISEIDFFKVKREDAYPFCGIPLCGGYGLQDDLILVTESGYLLLAKAFADDLAWMVQRDLVASYFRKGLPVTGNTDGAASYMPAGGGQKMEVETEELIRCAEIMAGCLDGNRRYVLNILRSVVPDIEGKRSAGTSCGGCMQTGETPDHPEGGAVDTTDVAAMMQPAEIDMWKLRSRMQETGMSERGLAEAAGVSTATVRKWLSGTQRPRLCNRNSMCRALGKHDDFLTPKKGRRSKEI